MKQRVSHSLQCEQFSVAYFRVCARQAMFVYHSTDALGGANVPVLFEKFSCHFYIAKSKISQSVNSHFVIVGYIHL